jgi:4-oxalocrotonate tautomerase
MYAGRTDQQKAKLAEEITKAVMTVLKQGEESVSVGIEDIKPEDWAEKVFRPDILSKRGTIYKQPGYDPFR